MSVWGIGAYYDKDLSEEFILRNCACIGWSKGEAPALYKMFTSVKIGDIIYIKAFLPKKRQLLIKSVGIVTENAIRNISSELGMGLSVKWKRLNDPVEINITEQIYKNNVFNNTLYEEYNVSIIQTIISLLLENN